MNKWFLSSSGNGDLSTTIKGLLVALVPLVVMVAAFLGFKLTPEDIEPYIVAITGFISSAMILYGLLRKLYYLIYPKDSGKDIDSTPDEK